MLRVVFVAPIAIICLGAGLLWLGVNAEPWPWDADTELRLMAYGEAYSTTVLVSTIPLLWLVGRIMYFEYKLRNEIRPVLNTASNVVVD